MYQYTSHVFPFRCARVKTLSFSPFVHVFSHYKKILIKLYLFFNSSLSLSLLSCSVATIISFYIVFHHHHHHQCFFAGFGDGFICANRECEEKEYEEKECRSLSARCYYAFHSNKNTTIRERKDDDDDDDSPEEEE